MQPFLKGYRNPQTISIAENKFSDLQYRKAAIGESTPEPEVK